MMTNEVGKLLTAAEVAEMLHLHVNTVKRLGDRGELPFFRVCKRGDRRFLDARRRRRHAELRQAHVLAVRSAEPAPRSRSAGR